MNFPIQEHEHTINGVSGRMFTIHEPQNVRGNMVLLNQKWISEGRKINGYGTEGVIHVNIRFDDQCKNSHMSFSITADVYTKESRRQRDTAACGCLHDDIAKIFPELIPLIKWHLASTDGPMHYLSNTLYHAGNRDHSGFEPGQPCSFQNVIFFGNSPVSINISNSFSKFIELRKNTGDFKIIEIAHNENGIAGKYQFKSKYTFVGYGEKWYECPFENETVALQWLTAINSGNFRIEKIVTEYSKGKERDLNAARESACWLEATDEQLTLPKEDLKILLEKRLSALIAEFKHAMDNAGFIWM